MFSDKRYVMCDSRVGKNVAHFRVCCGEFERDQLVQLVDVCRFLWARECFDEFWRVDEEVKGHCCWETGWRAYATE